MTGQERGENESEKWATDGQLTSRETIIPFPLRHCRSSPPREAPSYAPVKIFRRKPLNFRFGGRGFPAKRFRVPTTRSFGTAPDGLSTIQVRKETAGPVSCQLYSPGMPSHLYFFGTELNTWRPLCSTGFRRVTRWENIVPTASLE
ncbi:hypothetical protein CSHISOI_04995 [Colletotrichum shisoi]|uniref:Uncharacterized protein n=1 Tax=Colletotrichum shisoi TaxID=2078593 RepID=A0A5Q4BTX8_9PEZI|nr:hypothetical protein CSHISOI_04995 [Colletotrichum shisoi]